MTATFYFTLRIFHEQKAFARLCLFLDLHGIEYHRTERAVIFNATFIDLGYERITQVDEFLEQLDKELYPEQQGYHSYTQLGRGNNFKEVAEQISLTVGKL